METKCPVCGAPLENGSCGYCGYADKTSSQPTIDVNELEEAHETFHQTEILHDQQPVFNPVITNNINMIPGISRKSKTVALLLCIFLGGLGVHRFYVGKAGMGILYLCTFGLFGFGWIIDIILIATGSFRDEFGLPLQQ